MPPQLNLEAHTLTRKHPSQQLQTPGGCLRFIWGTEKVSACSPSGSVTGAGLRGAMRLFVTAFSSAVTSKPGITVIVAYAINNVQAYCVKPGSV